MCRDLRVPRLSGSRWADQHSTSGEWQLGWKRRNGRSSMTYSLLARAAIGASALALFALAALHILKPEIHPSRNMISQYALGRHGWVMALCFTAFGAASACLFAVLAAQVPSLLGQIGLALLLTAAIGLAMAAASRWILFRRRPHRGRLPERCTVWLS
jgi:hypothetical protein